MAYDEQIANAINTYILDKVWNEPPSEFRENIKPILLQDKSSIGNFSTMYGTTLPLPTSTSAYYVYGVSNTDMSIDINIPVGQWISTVDVANDYNVLFHFYTLKGFMCCKGHVYLRYSKDRRYLYIAIDKKMILKIDSTFRDTGVYFTIYYDSDQPNPFTVDSFRVRTENLEYEYDTRFSDFYEDVINSDHVSMFVNGKEYSGPYTPKYNDYVDLINDQNIIVRFTVDLTDGDYGKLYNSDRDGHYKYIVHIPKELNPDNKVLTHNTCDMFVRGNLPVEGATIGTYLHRCADQSVDQVTHNDFSVPLHIVDAFRDYIEQQHVSILVVIRQHEKDNHLIRDKSYIDLLYTHDDRDIIRFLTGQKTEYPQLSFWTAKELEKSTYIEFLTDTPENITSQFITDYTKGLGYYHMVSLICERVLYNTITPAFTGALAISKPYLYRGHRLQPVVYLNGAKILKELVDITYEDDELINIRLSDNIQYKNNDQLVAVLYLDGTKDIYDFVPTDTDPHLYINTKYYDVYEMTEGYTEYRGLQSSSRTLYKHVDATRGYYVEHIQTDGTTKLTFGSICYGKRYVVVNKYNTYYFDVDIDPMVSTGGNIVVNLEYMDITDTTAHPILNTKNSSVYLNGRYLIKDLGYQIKHVTDDNGNISFTQFILQGFDHLLDSNNRLEIYLHMAEEEDRSYHFVREDIITDHTPINLWYPTLTCCHINGLLETDVEDYGRYIKLPEGKYNNGDAFEVQTAIPKVVNDFLKKYHDNDDKARLEILNDYFGRYGLDMSGLLLLPHNYRIYSVFMNYVIRKILFEGLVFVVDPDMFRRQHQLEEYRYLMDLDLTYITDDKILEFIDYYPAYQQYEGTAEQYTMIREFIEAYKPQDKILSGGDYHG